MAEVVTEPGRVRVAFDPDDNQALPRLLVRNMVLGFLTLGFYRFWAKTALRRHFWSRISLAGEPLEYIGQGRELFIGFLIVMAVFMPVSIGYSVLQVMLADEHMLLGVFSLLYSAGVFVLIAAATFRARRYRLSRTLWRGIRAGQDGSTWRYIGLHCAWILPVMFTLGLALPWASASLARYRMAHTVWGSYRGAFSGTGRSLLRSWLPFWALGLAGLALVAVYAPLSGLFRELATDDPGAAYPLAAILGFSAGYILFQVAWLRWYLGHSSLGPLRFSCDLRLRRLILFVIPAAVLPPLYALIMGMLGSMLVSVVPTIVLKIAVGAVMALAAWGGLRIIWMLLVYVPIMRRVVTSIAVENLEAAEEARQSEIQTERFGEGLADSFEIGIA